MSAVFWLLYLFVLCDHQNTTHEHSLSPLVSPKHPNLYLARTTMSLQHDSLNLYGCPSNTRLAQKPQPAGFVGPAASFLTCVNPTNPTQTAQPTVWNPIYNQGTQPPANAVTAAAAVPAAVAAGAGAVAGFGAIGGGTMYPSAQGFCVPAQLAPAASAGCGWIWALIAAIVGILIVILLIWGSSPRKDGYAEACFAANRAKDCYIQEKANLCALQQKKIAELAALKHQLQEQQQTCYVPCQPAPVCPAPKPKKSCANGPCPSNWSKIGESNGW